MIATVRVLIRHERQALTVDHHLALRRLQRSMRQRMRDRNKSRAADVLQCTWPPSPPRPRYTNPYIAPSHARQPQRQSQTHGGERVNDAL